MTENNDLLIIQSFINNQIDDNKINSENEKTKLENSALQNFINNKIDDNKNNSENEETTLENSALQNFITNNNNNNNGWEGENLNIIVDWIKIASYKIELLSIYIEKLRQMLLFASFYSLILSTVNGTIGVANYNYSKYQDYSQTTTVINILIIVLSFCVSLITGMIKSLQVQETLEKFIQLKQEWVNFSVHLGTELQLPTNMRREAKQTIDTYKAKFLDLLKTDITIPSLFYSEKTPEIKNLDEINELIELVKSGSRYEDDYKDIDTILNSKKFHNLNRNKIKKKIKKIREFTKNKKNHNDNIGITPILSIIALEQVEKNYIEQFKNNYKDKEADDEEEEEDNTNSNNSNNNNNNNINKNNNTITIDDDDNTFCNCCLFFKNFCRKKLSKKIPISDSNNIERKMSFDSVENIEPRRSLNIMELGLGFKKENKNKEDDKEDDNYSID